MPEEIKDGTQTGDGQVDAGPQAGQTGADTQIATGQPKPAAGTTGSGTQQADDVIYDPQEFERQISSLSPELQSQAKALQKSLQSNYTKKTQSIAQERQKIEAYNAFMSDPMGQMQRLAAQYGLTITRGGQLQQAGQQKEWEPQNWNEVMDRATQIAEQKILQRFGPVLHEVQNLRKSSIESQLNEIDPSWTTYEEQMMGTLQKHPTLANDPATLYRMSVPPEVLESRAVQRALHRMEEKGKAAQTAGQSTTNKKPSTNMPDRPVSFQEAVEIARKRLAEQGIRPA